MMNFQGEQQPIGVLVDIIAKAVAARWKKLKDTQAGLEPTQRAFAASAYEYLARRERGTYKLERENALHWARATYRRPLDLLRVTNPSTCAAARRDELRREAWTEFRIGTNRLWLLEAKSKKA
jgi:hypothetical protein